MRFDIKKIFVSLIVLLAVTLMLYQPVNANAAVLGLKTSIQYDIYFGVNNDSSSVVRNVKLIRTAQIDGVTFLVIKSKSNKFDDFEAFVKLDEIMALVPHDTMDVQSR